MKRLTILAVAVTTLAITPVGSAHANTTTIQVKGGDFYFKLSTKTIAKPGKVTFVFKNVGHVLHDFKISGKKTFVLDGHVEHVTARVHREEVLRARLDPEGAHR